MPWPHISGCLKPIVAEDNDFYAYADDGNDIMYRSH